MMRFYAALFLMAAVLTTAPAVADQILEIKAGEWVHTMSMGNQPPGPPMKTCTKTDRKMTDEILNKMMSKMPGTKCSFTHSRAGETVTVSSTCLMGRMTMQTETAMSVLSEDEYAVVSKTHTENGPAGLPADMSMRSHWSRTGPCQPGDRVMPESP